MGTVKLSTLILLPVYNYWISSNELVSTKFCFQPPIFSFSLLKMAKLWVKFKPNNATQVSTEGCQNADDFLEACKKKLFNQLTTYDADQLLLSLTDGGPALRPGLKLADIALQPEYSENDDEHPFFITTIAESTLGTAVLIGRVMKVCINQNKLIRKYLTPVGSIPTTPSGNGATAVDLATLTLKLDYPMFYSNSSYRYCVVVECRQSTLAIMPPSITIVLITAFGDKPLEEALAQEDFKRVMPISPTSARPGTACPLNTTPEWMPHPKHKTPSYVLCIPIQVNLTHIQECEEDDTIFLDSHNLHKLKLHLLSLGGLAANAEFVDSDEEEDDDDGSIETSLDKIDRTVRWSEIVV